VGFWIFILLDWLVARGSNPRRVGLGGEVVFCASDPVDFVKSRIRVEGIGFFPCGKTFCDEGNRQVSPPSWCLECGEFVGCKFHFFVLVFGFRLCRGGFDLWTKYTLLISRQQLFFKKMKIILEACGAA
jgi:hypothetical protein